MKVNIRRGDVWLINYDPVIGREQGGTRPGVVISVNGFNKTKSQKIITVPITSKFKLNPLNIIIEPPEGGTIVESYVKCEDIRSTSIDRLVEKWGEISTATMNEIEKKLRFLLGL